MVKIRNLALVAGVVSILVVGGTAFAANSTEPINAESNFRRFKNVRLSQMSEGKFLDEFKDLEDFKAKMLEQKQEILKQKVEEGLITQEKSYEIRNLIKERQETCNSERMMIGRNMGAQFGERSEVREEIKEAMGSKSGRGRMSKFRQ